MNEFMEALCKDDLSKLRYYERRIAEIPDEIAEEQARLTSIKSSTTGSTPVQGGGNKREEWLVSALDRIERLKADLRYFEGKVRLTYRALDRLGPEDQRILVVLYVDKIKRGADVLMDELDIDTRTVWRKREGALRDYCTARYTNIEK